MKNGIEPTLIKSLDDLGITPSKFTDCGITDKGIAEVVESLIKTHGDEAAEMIIQHGDDAVKIISNYGDDGLTAIYVYGNEAIDVTNKYADDAISAINNGIEPTLIKSLDDLGVSPTKFADCGIVNKEAAEIVETAINNYGKGTIVGIIYKHGSDGINAIKNGLNPNLLYELITSDVKYDIKDTLMVVKNTDDILMWLEKGNGSAGLQHILERHSDDFLARGIDDIVGVLENILSIKPINSGSNSSGLFADYLFNDNMYRVAYGTNGFIVSFYPI